MEGHAGLFFKGRNPAKAGLPPFALRPLDSKIHLQHRRKKWPFINTDLLWGCPQMNFKANPPFNEMRQGFAAFKKETRMAQYLP